MQIKVPNIVLPKVKQVEKHKFCGDNSLYCPHCLRRLTKYEHFSQYDRYTCPQCESALVFVGFTDSLPTARRKMGEYYAVLTWIN